ncbi:MAG: HAMP domain-containing protein, partial [Rubrobacter sp.]|nr:HAMP domain-containing protein [Rubrobacter sp.]
MLASVYVLTLGVAAIGVAINVLLTDQLNADADAVLRARADAQRTTVGFQSGKVVVNEGTQDEAFDREAWVFADGVVIARPPASKELDRAASELADARSGITRNVPGEIRLLAEPVFAPDDRTQIATVVVAVSLLPYERSERIARIGTIVLGLFVVFAGAVIAWRATGAGLRPVARMARQAATYGEHDLSRRFDLGRPRDELTTLAATLDGLLDRLQASLRREQRLTAEIAHELRTPLSGIRAEAELGLQPTRSAEERRESLDAVLTGVDRLSSAIDALLRAARRTGPDTASCDLGEAITAAVRANATAAGEHRVAIAFEQPLKSRSIGAEAAFVIQLLNPLLANAVRHASTAVRVSTVAANDHVQIRVRDDGPGIADGDVDSVFEA